MNQALNGLKKKYTGSFLWIEWDHPSSLGCVTRCLSTADEWIAVRREKFLLN